MPKMVEIQEYQTSPANFPRRLVSKIMHIALHHRRIGKIIAKSHQNSLRVGRCTCGYLLFGTMQFTNNRSSSVQTGYDLVDRSPRTFRVITITKKPEIDNRKQRSLKRAKKLHE